MPTHPSSSITTLSIEYEKRETTKNGFVDGVDTGAPDDFRTFTRGPAHYFIAGVETDRETFAAAVAAEM